MLKQISQIKSQTDLFAYYYNTIKILRIDMWFFCSSLHRNAILGWSTDEDVSAFKLLFF